MSAFAIALVAAGALFMVAACAWAVLRSPRTLEVPENDTVAFVLEGPNDGQVVRVEGTIVLDEPLKSPSGRPVVLYELYASVENGPARPVKRRGLVFQVHDGERVVRVDPAFSLVAFDLPTSALDCIDGAEGDYVERRLEVGTRVQVVGRILRRGAPGHEEFSLLPVDAQTGVALTFLEAPRAAPRRAPAVENRARA